METQSFGRGNRKSCLDANHAAFKTRNEAKTKSNQIEEAKSRPYLAYIWQTHAAKPQNIPSNRLFPKKKCRI